MAKRTKAQKKRLLNDMVTKAKHLCFDEIISVNDYNAIAKIRNKGMKKLM